MMHVRVRENWYRDIWLLAVTVFVVLAIKTQSHQTNEIQSGRQAGTAISCATTGALANGGVNFIRSSAEMPLPPQLESLLARYGYPPASVRHAAAKSSARAYAEAIDDAITAAVPQAHGLIVTSEGKHPLPGEPNIGRVRCGLLERLTKVH